MHATTLIHAVTMHKYRKQQKFRGTKLSRFRGFSIKRESFPYILIKSSEPRKFCTAELLLFTVVQAELTITNNLATVLDYR